MASYLVYIRFLLPTEITYKIIQNIQLFFKKEELNIPCTNSIFNRTHINRQYRVFHAKLYWKYQNIIILLNSSCYSDPIALDII